MLHLSQGILRHHCGFYRGNWEFMLRMRLEYKWLDIKIPFKYNIFYVLTFILYSYKNRFPSTLLSVDIIYLLHHHSVCIIYWSNCYPPHALTIYSSYFIHSWNHGLHHMSSLLLLFMVIGLNRPLGSQEVYHYAIIIKNAHKDESWLTKYLSSAHLLVLQFKHP